MSKRKDHSWLVPKGFVPPVDVDVRICFGIAWFEKEEDAEKYSDQVKKEGRKYNGGWYHGCSCGRDSTWDDVCYKGYAVTF